MNNKNAIFVSMENMIRMREKYQLIIDTVCRVTGFSENQILHDRRMLCVDARYLLIHILSEYMPCHEIVYYSGLSKQCVSQCSNLYANRARFNRSLQVEENIVRSLLNL